jgi:hypothetical protein
METTLVKSPTKRLALGLGWFSIALGLAELIFPRRITKSLGMEGEEALVQAYGVREIVKGVGILSSNDPTPWLWGRVAGDVLDIGTLVAHLRADNPKRANVAIAMANVATVTALDAYCAKELSASRTPRLTETSVGKLVGP